MKIAVYVTKDDVPMVFGLPLSSSWVASSPMSS